MSDGGRVSSLDDVCFKHRFRPFMLAAETAAQALARVRPAIDALATFSEERASAVEAPLALPSDAVLAPGAAGVVEVAALPLATAVADAFVGAFVGGDNATRDDVLTCVKSTSELGYPERTMRGPRDSPRHRAEAVRRTTSRRWRGVPEI